MTLDTEFFIDGFRVLPGEGRIDGPAGSFRVEPKAMDVLLELARHAPRVRTREQILRAVWSRGYVSDDVLTRCIGQLRRAFGDDAHSPRLLETIPKRGYRLCRPAALAHECEPARSAEPSVPAQTLIVLPLRPVSAGGDAFVAEGITDLLILQLCSLKGVRVISRTTAARFAFRSGGISDVVEATGADWVVEGSVIQEANHVQVVVRLIESRTDFHRWGAEFKRELHDLLPLINQVAEQVGQAIHARIGHPVHGQATVLSSDVVRAYLLARQAISARTADELRDAVGRFEALTVRAPGFASAWASRAECELLLAHYGAPDAQQLIDGCHEHIERALALEPGLPVAMSARSAVRLFFDRDVEGAARDAERALAGMPQYVMAMLARANVAAVRQDFAVASAWIEQAHLTDPLDVGIAMNVGDHMIFQRRYDDAVLALERAVRIVPGHRPSRWRLAWALALCGRADEALASMQHLASESGTGPAWLEYAALVAAAAGDAKAALKHHRALRMRARTEPVSAWALARSAAAAGCDKTALHWLEQASAQRASWLAFLHLMPEFDRLHGSPRLDALARVS